MADDDRQETIARLATATGRDTVFIGWHCANGLVLTGADNPPTEPARCVWLCRADSWEEACRRWHERNGWEPYRRITDA